MLTRALIGPMRPAIAAGLFLLILGGGAIPARAGHFPAPAFRTPLATDYYVDFRIDGVAARRGDEIAFFDPQGVLCGQRAVEPSDEGGLMIVPVYGDLSQTPAVDEGAVTGDPLTVRIWQAATGREYAGSGLKLTRGAPLGNALPSPIPPLWQEGASFTLNVDTATHFAPPIPTPFVSTFYVAGLTVRGAPADIGDEVAVFDSQGVLCGLSRVTAPGDYLIIEVYGDNAETVGVDEGATAGNPLTFRVWDNSAGIEYAGDAVSLAAGSAIGFSIPSLLPPVWTEDEGYVLNVAVAASSAVPGDINHNAVVDLADAILALRIVSGSVPSLPSLPRYADVNGDGRIGLEEILFILQKLGGLR